MRSRLFNLAAICSAIASGSIVLAWLVAGDINPGTNFVSLSRDCHLSLFAYGFDARLEVFSDAAYGPYHGGILGLANAPPLTTVSGFGDTAGIYYRAIRWGSGGRMWTLSLSLAYPLLVSTVVPFAWLAQFVQRRGRGFPVETTKNPINRPSSQQ